MSDLISRSEAVKAIIKIRDKQAAKQEYGWEFEYNGFNHAILALPMPFAEPEIKPISYQDCSNAMLMMWMDNVITDGEYNRIMDKLNAKHMAERKSDE